MLFFRFDKWHTSPFENRQYACDILSEIEGRINMGAILELGCGLGDIIGKTNYKEKYFYDISSSVLKAAQFLQIFSFKKSKNIFKVFNFLEDTLDKQIHLDAIIFVNWIHDYEPETLKKKLSDMIKTNLRPEGLVVFDVIEKNPNYKFNHSFENLIDTDQFNIKVSEGYKFGRKLVYASLKSHIKL